jgi:N-acetylneuraminic acid mutarotase
MMAMSLRKIAFQSGFLCIYLSRFLGSVRMRKQTNPSNNAHLLPNAFMLLSLLTVCAVPFVLGQRNSANQFQKAEFPSAKRTLTFAERVAYQQAIEEVYWRHRIWPKENANPKPNLDQVMSASEIQKRVEDYLRKSQVLEDYWQRPITAEQLQFEMDRMAKQTRQPEMLRELFQALGNDPFVTAECLARPALAERLLTSWYAYDQQIHGALKQRAETELHAHPGIDQMKQLSGKYSEVELIKSDSTQGEDKRSVGSVKLNSREWDETVQKLTAVLGDAKNNTNHTNILSDGARLAGDKAVFGTMTEIKVGVLSSLQEDEGHFYATAVIDKTNDRLKLATVSWLKEPRESWLARAEEEAQDAVAEMGHDYTLPRLSGGAGCVDDTWTTTAGPPDGRQWHTAVWTGTEMIVWGGRGFGTYFSTGAKYDPSTDTWTATSTTNAPGARAYHTAVWTGSEMIIWGGYSYGGTFNTGGRYDPAKDNWTATNTTNVPAAREYHTAVWTGSEMIVWGGYFYDGVEHWLNTGGRYNPVTNSWTAISLTNAPFGRRIHTAIWAGNEMIVWGGEVGSYTYSNTGGRYNPNTDSWTATSLINAPEARWYHTAVWTGSEMIVWGGQDYPTFLNTGGRYTPGTDSWTTVSTTNAPSVRAGHTAVWTGNEMIVWGGYDENLLNTGGRYTPGTGSWTATSTANAPSSRELHTAIWTGSEMIVWGGEAGILNSNIGGRYNPTVDSWTATGANNAPAARSVHTALWTGSEMIVWGGYFYDGNYHNLNTGGRYNPATDHWTATSTTNAPEARYFHTAVWTGSEMIIWGGSTFDYIYLNTGGRYNPIADSWTATNTVNGPIARWLHTAVWTGSEMVVWGGHGDSGEFNTGGRYNPSTDSWIATNTKDTPIARASHTAVWTGSEMIVWGGWNGPDDLNSGGRYDPVTDVWTATSITNAPIARAYHTAVWIGSEMIVWGGYHEFNAFNTGARYNPGTNSWTATSIANAPSARFNHTAVWTGTETIIWGGSDYVGDRFNTGGRYNAGTDIWTATSINGPISRSSHTAVWTGSEMIVWGGYDGLNYLNTGDRYCAQSGSTATPTPTTTPTPSVTPTATATPRPSPTPRVAPSPRVRPTPAPRP